MTAVACVGITVWDLVFTVEHLPQGAGKHLAVGLVTMGGGPAANAAVAIVSLGGEAKFIGAVGDDSEGKALVEELSRLNVDVSRVRVIPGTRSPLSAITVDPDGERSIVNYTDPALFTLASPVTETDLVGADAILADVRWPAGATTALRWAKTVGIPGVLDFDVGDTDPIPLVEAASHVVFSAQALQDLTGEDKLEEGLAQLADLTDAWLAVTAGAEGTLWLDGGHLRRHPGFAVEAVDTTGAGDVYHAALALGVASGDRRIEETIEFASAAAALSCTRLGARAGIPRRDEVESFLRERRS